jgi:HlyD family secretion protein
MNVDAEIVVQSVNDVLAIPVEAVSRGNRVLVQTDGSVEAGADSSTLTIGENGIPEGFEYVQITLGVNNDEYIEVTDGLSEGDVIAVVSINTDTGDMTTTMAIGGISGSSGGGGPSGGPPSGGGGPMGG